MNSDAPFSAGYPLEGESIAWDDSSVKEDPAEYRVYDLAERTARFGEEVVRFAKKFPGTPVNRPLVGQFVRAGTSVGANYREANDAISPKDFRHRISICRKEAKETQYWLRTLATAAPNLGIEARALWKEASQLNRIFPAIWRNART